MNQELDGVALARQPDLAPLDDTLPWDIRARRAVKARPRKRRPAISAAAVTRTQLARLLHVHPDTVSKYVSEGMPVVTRGGHGAEARFDQTEAMIWWQAHHGSVSSLAAERAKLARVQSQRVELDLETRRRELLPVADVCKAWATLVQVSKSRLLALPRALADRIVQAIGAGTPAAIEQILTAGIHHALAELAAWAPPPPKRKRP